MLSERDQSQRATCCVIPFTGSVHKRQIYRLVLACRGLGRGEQGVIADEYAVSVEGNKNVLELDSGDDGTTL